MEGCAEKYGSQLRFALLNTTNAKRLAMSQKVMGLPTIVVYQNGEKVETLSKDSVSEASVVELIEKHV